MHATMRASLNATAAWSTTAIAVRKVDSIGRCNISIKEMFDGTINGLYKPELIHRRAPWKTKESVELATLEWVAWFNNHRLLEPIGYVPPAEAEANYYQQLASQATTVVAA